MVDINMFEVKIDYDVFGKQDIIYIDNLTQLDTVDITSELVIYEYTVEYKGARYMVVSFRVEESDKYPGQDKITLFVR